MAAVDDTALAEGVDRLRQGMALFAVVESGMASPTQIGVFEPVEHEQRPLNLAVRRLMILPSGACDNAGHERYDQDVTDDRISLEKTGFARRISVIALWPIAAPGSFIVMLRCVCFQIPAICHSSPLRYVTVPYHRM